MMREAETMYGKRIFITPDTPKMQLSEDVPVSADVRAETNAWMLDFFGVSNMLEDGVVWAMATHVLMNRRTYERLRRSLA